MSRTDRLRTRQAERRSHKMSPARESWLSVGMYSLAFYDYSADPEADDPEGRTVSIHLPGRTAPSYLMLDSLNAEELDALKAFLNRVIDGSRPTCEDLDASARAARDSGDGDSMRLYRPKPVLHRQYPDRPIGGHEMSAGPIGNRGDN